MRKNIMKKVTTLAMAFVVLSFAFAFSLPALASDFQPWNASGATDNGESFAGSAGLPGSGVNLYTTITNIIRWVMGFLGIIAVIVILIGGFKWMTAGGSEDKVGEAKKLLISGIIGLIIVILAYAIATFVISTLINVTTAA